MKRKRQFPGATAYTDRFGIRRWRYRAPGIAGRSFSLGTDYGSDEFTRRYEAAVAAVASTPLRLPPPALRWHPTFRASPSA